MHFGTLRPIVALVAVTFLATTAQTALGQTVPGYFVNTYATVTDPIRLSFSPSGVLFTGRDNSGSGGGTGDPVFINRVGVGGSPVTNYGNTPIQDPDGVVYDAIGAISGQVGSVLVGGGGVGGGRITAVRPDQSVVTVFGPSSNFVNPTDVKFDLNGRFLIADGPNGVFASLGGDPTNLFTLPGGVAVNGLDVGVENKIYTVGGDGVIRIHNPDGTLFNSSFAVGVDGSQGGNLAIGTGEVGFGTDLFSTSLSGELLRIDAATGSVSVMGTGFTSINGLTFGPDGALYAADFTGDRILVITPVPEPTGLLLTSLFAGGCVWWRSRQRKRLRLTNGFK